jgi:hypothetical protein
MGLEFVRGGEKEEMRSEVNTKAGCESELMLVLSTCRYLSRGTVLLWGVATVPGH